MKKKVNILSIISLVIAVVATGMFWLLLGKVAGFIYVPWLITGTISFLFPILAKYFRKINGNKGNGFEITAMILGFYNFYWVLSVATKWHLTIILLLCVLVCVLYCILFKNIQQQTKHIKKTEQHKKITDKKKFFQTIILIGFIICAILVIIVSIISNFYGSGDAVEFTGNISLILGILFLIIYIYLVLAEKYYKSVMYKEKCYKRVEKIKKYLDNGIITQEEFEKNKSEILKHIQ